jgi:hypothetical protein
VVRGIEALVEVEASEKTGGGWGVGGGRDLDRGFYLIDLSRGGRGNVACPSSAYHSVSPLN